MKLLATLKRISVNFSSHDEFIRAVVAFSKTRNATMGSWTPVLCTFLLSSYCAPAQVQRMRLCFDARIYEVVLKKSVCERTNSN